MLRAMFTASCAVLFIHSPSYAKKFSDERIPSVSLSNRVSPTDGPDVSDARFAIAAANTTVLYTASFDLGISCQTQGWTTVDLSFTAQTGTFWHVDDFAGVNVHPGDSYAPIAGAKSLWCGVRAGTGDECFYATAPGYGRMWNQAWKTKACIPVTGPLNVFFQMHLDSEPGYDASLLEYTADCAADFRDASWDVLAGGINQWDGVQDITHSASYNVGAGPVLVRIRFLSDGTFSDDDGLYDSHSGPIVIDNLVVEGLAVETFEDEFVGDTSADDWETEISPGYGNYFALFPGTSLVQQDGCAKNLSCVWAAIAGSSQTYACGGFPQQAAVPRRNQYGEYIQNAIVSPPILLTGTGSRINLQFSVYRDLPIDNLVFYFWDVRGLANGCAGPWRPGNWYFGNQKDWRVDTFALSPFIDLASATHIQVRLGVFDACPVLCGPLGTGSCHSHAPLFDNVKVYRVDMSGPMFTTRDFDMFQDTFPTDGTDTGIGRADAALSITAAASPTILPGDSARIIVSDPVTAVPGVNPSGLETDNLGGNNGNKACYLYVNVSDNGVFNPAKSGAILSGGALYPFKDTVVADGKTWTRIQCWLRVVGTNTFVVDLNDNLFQAGDVVNFFFGATNTLGQTTYCSGSALNYVQEDVQLAAETASEFSILPVLGNGTDGRDLLYVDGMDGRGAQEYWDISFERFNLVPDRYDVRGPTSSFANGNGPGNRVRDVAQQLHANYQGIIWDTGDLSTGIGDGTTAGAKSNDYGMLNAFLGGANKRLYICGDDAPSGLSAAAGSSAVTFRTVYITYSLTTGDHRPSYGVAPAGIGSAGGFFAGDTWVIYGGCPLLNDFDVMAPTGTTTTRSSYGPMAAGNAAEVSKITGTAWVMLSGYSFIYIRDDEADGTLDRTKHLRGILQFLDMHPVETGVGADPIARTRLEQNYPNPFNPATTIAFSLKARSRVRIDVIDVTGAHVRTLVDETRAAGSHSDVRWDGRNVQGESVASGVYFYRLRTDSFEKTRKMVLLK